MNEKARAYGTTYLVLLPDHPDDLTVRAVEVLGRVALVVGGDVKRAAPLLRKHGIKTVVSAPRLPALLRRLATGDDVALLLADETDPAAGLAAGVDEAGFAVVALPSATALATALPAAGFGGQKVNMLGRLPAGKKRRASTLVSCAADPRPIALSANGADLAVVFQDLRETLGDRFAMLVDEQGVTTRGALSELTQRMPERPGGQWLLVVAGRDPERDEVTDLTAIAARATELLAAGDSTAGVARQLTRETCLTRQEAYRLANRQAATRRSGGQVVQFSFRGHPAIRGTHHKTIEFKRDADCSARETCVVGVDADWDPAALKGLQGPVEVTIEVGDRTETVQAEISRRFDDRDRLVIRLSRHDGPVTLAVGADRAAGDLDREMVAALADPETGGVVTIRARD
jgi:16S rRNA (cytidine1402-2'-O)-methyltransferase